MANRKCSRLATIASAEFAQDPGDVPLNGARAQEQMLHNLRIGQPAGEQDKHREFTLREPKLLWWSGRAGTRWQRSETATVDYSINHAARRLSCSYSSRSSAATS